MSPIDSRIAGETDLTLIEVQSGSYLGEDDIVRFEDIYGRTSGRDRLAIRAEIENAST